MKVRFVHVVRLFVLALTCLPITAPLSAQKNKRDPLTEVEAEKIREAGIDPAERVKLYTKFVDEHMSTIKGLTNRGHSPARAKRLDDELQSLTSLMDELGTNLDTYSDRHADLRPALKPLTESTQRWLLNLRALAGESEFNLSRKEAIESGQDLADQAERLLREQTDYFNVHKDERGQERSEPH
jgi:transcriptional regulator of met regulon